MTTHPVLLILFNRPDPTRSLLLLLRELGVKKLYIACDAPRAGNDEDVMRCGQVKELVAAIDWAETSTLFHDANLGVGRGPVAALDWFFDREEAGIVLEDDCHPVDGFLRFCSELLERYGDDPRIGMITGNRFYPNRADTPYSYAFSRYGSVWGWASWRRVWKGYDYDMALWPQVRRDGLLRNSFAHAQVAKWWDRTFQEQYEKSAPETWDYQLLFHLMKEGQLSILPNANLVANVGWGEDATHTKMAAKPEYLQTGSVAFPLRHPPYVAADIQTDKKIERERHNRRSIPERALRKLVFKARSLR